MLIQKHAWRLSCLSPIAADEERCYNGPGLKRCSNVEVGRRTSVLIRQSVGANRPVFPYFCYLPVHALACTV